MENNRPLTIYTASSRKQTVLQAAPTDVQGLFERLGVSQALPVTHEAYTTITKAKQDELKDIGAFIAGELKNGRRRSGCVLARCAAVLDADNLPAGSTEDFIRRVEGLGCCYLVYSTAKHSPATPRLRVVVPLAQDIPAEQYAPVARLLCKLIQLEMTWFDPSTDEAGRIMYYPAHCQDIAPVLYMADKPLLDAAALLAQLQDWRDAVSWPRFPREQAPAKVAAKQEDPEGKTGVVGAFCRVYDVPAAMEKFLPGVYVPTTADDRYTFAAGSSWGGATVYEGGKFLFSHHATDPAGGRLVNAFDLVRMHRFADLDDEAKEGTPAGRLPSYTAMTALAREDSAVSDVRAREAFAAATADFKDVETDEEAAMELGRCEGKTLSTSIVRLALKAFGIQAKRNLITGAVEITGMPTAYSKEGAANTLPTFLMDNLRSIGVKGASRTAVMDHLANIFDENRYNPVLDMLGRTVWDGHSRFPELLRIISVSSSSLEATLVRKWLIQCVAMANNTIDRREAAEGVLTLQGGQGLGKTLFFRRLSVSSEWFAEGVTLDLKNKDSVISATGAWITELGELDSTLKREQSILKAFLTSPSDRIRAPYAREAETQPRRTSFCATVNPGTFLKDDTGDRRFWVVPVDKIALQTLIELPDSWFVQLWGEAVTWWVQNPQGFRLTAEERGRLEASNRRYRELLPGEEEIRQAFNFELPMERWGEFSGSELRGQLLFLDRTTTQQVGRVLAKLAREDERITRRTLDGYPLYRLPLLKAIGDFETESSGA